MPTHDEIVRALHEWMDEIENARDDYANDDTYNRVGCLIAWIEGFHPTYKRDVA